MTSVVSSSVNNFNNLVPGKEPSTAPCKPKNDREAVAASVIQRAFRTHLTVKKETLTMLKQAFSTLKFIKNEEDAEVTLHLKYGRTMEIFPLRIRSSNLGFDFRIPLKNGGVNKAFDFYTFHRDSRSSGHLQDLYPGYGLKEDYRLRGYDLMRLADMIAKAFKLSEITLNDKSSCWEVDGIKEYEGKKLEEELARFANLHHLSLEKDSRNRYCNNIIEDYNLCLIFPPGGFDLKYSRAMIEGNSWYGKHGYYPSSMTSDEYLEFIDKLRATDLCQCFPENSSEESPFVELMYREFAIHTGNDREHSLGNFFKWLSAERPHAISDVIKDIRGARAGRELQRGFYKIEGLSGRMVKRCE